MQSRIELYEKAVPLAKLGIWERNMLTGQIYWNEVIREILDVDESYNPSLHETLSLYLEPHLVSKMIEDAIQLKEGQHGKLRLRTVTGQLKWVNVHVKASFNGDQNISIYGTLEDITAQQNIFNILEEREHRFFQAFDHAPIGMALISLSGQWLKVNASLANLLRYSEEEFIGHSIQDWVQIDDLETLMQLSHRLKTGEGNSFSLELQLLNKKGNPVWVMLSESIVRGPENEALYGIAHIKDISERRKHTEILLKERQRLDNIIKSTGVGTWEWEVQTDQLHYNQRAVELLGYDKQDFHHHHMSDWYQLIHPDDLKKNLQTLEDYFSQKNGFYTVECRMMHRSGTWIWIEIRGKVITWTEDGRALKMLGTYADIQERKMMEEEQNTALALIHAQNKRLLDFAHIVSHNLRSHTGNLQMLMEVIRTEKDHLEQKKLVEMLGTNVNNLEETLAHLNDVIKVRDTQELNLTKINLYEEIQKTLAMFAQNLKQAEAGIKLEVAPHIIVTSDHSYLASILLNLISNCIKYRNPDKPLEMRITAIEGNPLTLQVTDNGIGIDLKMHGHKLFGMYKTFHGNSDARGIGLFLVKNQMEVMGGSISASSEVGKGTTFTLKFKNDG